MRHFNKICGFYTKTEGYPHVCVLNISEWGPPFWIDKNCLMIWKKDGQLFAKIKWNFSNFLYKIPVYCQNRPMEHICNRKQLFWIFSISFFHKLYLHSRLIEQRRGDLEMSWFAFRNLQLKKSNKVNRSYWITVQVNLFQKHLFLHQLTLNLTTDCSLNYEFSTCKFQAQNMLCT